MLHPAFCLRWARVVDITDFQMIKIRILAKYFPIPNSSQIPDAEIFVEETGNIKAAVEEIRIISGSLIKNFIDDWDAFIPKIQFLKANSPDDPSIDEEIRDKLEKKSNSLKSLLFQNREPFLKMNKTNFTNRILFVTDPEFASLPLEILTCKGNFLYQDHIITRQIRSEKLDKNLRTAKGMLLVSSSNNNEILSRSIQEECGKIQKILSNKVPDEDAIIHLHGRNLTLNRFLEELPNVSYLHYAGHSERSGIHFSGEELITDREIEKLGLGNLKIVFFNSCFSGFHSREVAGIAAAFLKSGAIHFVGYSQQVSTEAAKFTGVRFWEKIQKGLPVDRSIFELRKEIAEKFGKGETASFTLCHYGPESRKENRAGSRKLTIAAPVLLIALIAGNYFLRKDSGFKDIPNASEKNIAGQEQSGSTEKSPAAPVTVSKELPEQNSRKSIKRNKKYRNSERDIFEEAKIKLPVEIQKPIEPTKKIMKNENPSNTPSISKPYIPKNLEETISEIQSPRLKNAVEKFLNEEHAFLTVQKRESIVYDVLSEGWSDEVKYQKLRIKAGF